MHAALFLRTGGRLGLVLPAELLTVNYAAEVRKFLTERFAKVRLVLFAGNNRFFAMSPARAQAGVHHLNSVHGIYLQSGLRRLGLNLLPLGSLNSMTMSLRPTDCRDDAMTP